ncbi:MAG: FAD-dependent thymidylate synthase [Nitrospirota bacterium]|nr:FAD-dependent thymidylate synthase [Nitrospirota bacterium]
MKVTLVNIFRRPFDNAVAAARTCYSGKGLVTPEQVAGEHHADPEKRREAAARKTALAKSIYHAGHHTTLQHAHVQFALEGVSRQFIWSFLHSHPFYNSEQVSQRYVSVSADQVHVPAALDARQREFYLATVARQVADYQELTTRLAAPASAEYFRLFPARRSGRRGAVDVQKKAQEVARYVLPVGTTAYLYHTVSLLTLLRYRRMQEHYDTPQEQRAVVGEMVRLVLAADPELSTVLEEPLAPEEMAEQPWLEDTGRSPATTAAFIRRFDQRLGGRVSRLVDYSACAEEVMADAARQVFGLNPDQMPDDEAIRGVLDPSRNPLLGETLNLKAHGKLSRVMVHPHYTFLKKLSHTADSQDQRHRMTPASRPVLAAHATGEPDFITPRLVLQDAALERRYSESMQRTWEAASELRAMGASAEAAAYLLPNAQAVRFTESGDLAALHHKMAMRLCYNSQEEIWQAAVDEALQIRAVHPRLGAFLLPPCGLRDLAGVRPVCPEGDRYCGVKVWRLDMNNYTRLI